MLEDRDDQRGIELARGAAGYISIHLLALAVLNYTILIECGVPVFSICLGFLTGKLPRPTLGPFADVLITMAYLLWSFRFLSKIGWRLVDVYGAE